MSSRFEISIDKRKNSVKPGNVKREEHQVATRVSLQLKKIYENSVKPSKTQKVLPSYQVFEV